jgi:hypothetical protein
MVESFVLQAGFGIFAIFTCHTWNMREVLVS